LQSTLLLRKKLAYLEPNRNRMQKPIGGRSVLAVFHAKNMQKNNIRLGKQ
jgi:hypothetical protein